MKAFISYSHKDAEMLEMLHKHLTQLQRDGIISAWTDQEILPGGNVDQIISTSLETSDLFIALISPDYIASKYCYDQEFQKALKMQEQGNLIIIPIIIEPCDWLNTPFKKFKALPKDGKEISTWENRNTAFLDIIQNIRKLILSPTTSKNSQIELKSPSAPASRNYRIQRDFDSIEKMEYVEKTFHEIKDFLKRFIDEILQIDNIKARTLIDTDRDFECLLVNRNKIATESRLRLSIGPDHERIYSSQSSKEQINYTIDNSKRPSEKSFILAFDEYHLFWSNNNPYSGSRNDKEIGSKLISEMIWNEWLESVGIL